MRDVPLFSSSQLAALLQALPDPAFVLTRGGRHVAVFGGVDGRYYQDGSALVGKTVQDVLSAEKAAWFLHHIALALDQRTLHVVEYSLAASDVRGLPPDGPRHRMRFEGRIQALDFCIDGEAAVLWVASNITERCELEAKLRALSEIDALSGLLNRRKLMQVLAEHFDTFERYATPMTVLIFDLDHFKRVNDEHGHLQGDAAIKATADVCRHELRITDAPARLGGDEFVVLMPHTNCAAAEPIAERLRLRVAEALLALGTIGSGATISGGLAEFHAGDSSCEDALKRADIALYLSKRNGRNRITTEA